MGETSQNFYVYLVTAGFMEKNANHNNLCCALTPFIVCEECTFKACIHCDNTQDQWTLDTHNSECVSDNSRWDNDNYRVIMYKNSSASQKTPADILVWNTDETI